MAKGNFGERLKREREMREVSLNEITVATRIGPRFLEALENEDWEKLPGGVFNCGFVRSVARYLGLDEEGLLAEYDLARGVQAQSTPPPVEHRNLAPSRWIPLLVVLVILLLLVAGGAFGWRRYKAHRAAKQSASSSVPQQTQSPLSSTAIPPLTMVTSSASDPGSPAHPSPGPLELSVSTSAATRVRIVADDKLLLDAELRAGENRHFSASQQFEVTAADSSVVLLELNGQAMPPLGAPGASGTMVLSHKDLRPATSGNSQP
jgi:cytoskeletal protein RodZ